MFGFFKFFIHLIITRKFLNIYHLNWSLFLLLSIQIQTELCNTLLSVNLIFKSGVFIKPKPVFKHLPHRVIRVNLMLFVTWWECFGVFHFVSYWNLMTSLINLIFIPDQVWIENPAHFKLHQLFCEFLFVCNASILSKNLC